ncbi:hypothetical protein [Gimesia chilikensis]|uniref:Neutral metalloprotease n=1 Tax=Gimesia chilikensis TaxID=2605989 RepID=A0A517PLR1_9PLAN|nr:hypothetical protein [Gimesia chilikensis]QDT20309.1 hypothetical protein HG66A1_20950 [Gimesia chilikensis]
MNSRFPFKTAVLLCLLVLILGWGALRSTIRTSGETDLSKNEARQVKARKPVIVDQLPVDWEQPVEIVTFHNRPRFPLAMQKGDDYLLIVNNLQWDPGKAEKIRLSVVRDPAQQTASGCYFQNAPMFYEKQADQVRPADAAPLSSETNRETETQTDKPAPEDSRSFYLFVTDGDLSDKKQYTRVTGKLIKHSPRVAVYLDEQQQPTELAAGLIDEVIHLLEERVLDHLAQHCGSLTDVDDNGRFTVLLSPWLGKLQGGKTSINGFVRPSDFREKVAAPFSNHCDMLYLNSALKPGQELFDLLSHEVTHAVVSSIRIRQEQYLGHMLLDEEDWLNEGIAHIMEPGFTNRDYRISEFYRQPEAYPLIVPDYYRARLWRNHGCRGAVNLFLNWCNELDPQQRFTWEFTHHPLTGVDKMEDLTEVPFAELFRQWSLSLASQSLQSRFAYAGLSEHASPLHCGRFLLGGPALRTWDLSGDDQYSLKISSTASAFIHLRADQKRDVPTTIRVRGFPGMQLTLVRIPRSLPQTSLSTELVTTSDSEQNATNSVEIRLRCHHPTQSEVALIGAEYVGPGLSRSDRRPRHFNTEDLPVTLPSTTANQIQISRQETIGTESDNVSEYRLRVPIATLKRDNTSQSLLVKAVVRTQAGQQLVVQTEIDLPASSDSRLAEVKTAPRQ